MVAAAALAASALLAAGCGGGSPGGGVAHLGNSTASSTSTPDASGASGTAGAAGASGAARGPANAAGEAVAYASCMRSHGVPGFPDPQVSTHGDEVSIKMVVPAGAARGNPHFDSAQRACRKLLPGGGPGSHAAPQLSAREQTQVLRAVACMRRHGVPNLPDPTFTGGGVHLPESVNHDSAAFKSAARACESLIPSRLRGGR